MIIEKLQEKLGFTSTEELLANYILTHADDVTQMTGLSLESAFAFSERMTRIGYATTIMQDCGQQVYRAAISTKDQFAIVISHLGKTSKTLKIIKQEKG